VRKPSAWTRDDFRHVSSQAIGIHLLIRQLLHGVGLLANRPRYACALTSTTTTGVAAGDSTTTALTTSSLHTCWSSNRLYRNRGDGTFEDVTERSGVGVLTIRMRLFADFENKGLQDLLVVCATGPLLFLNQGMDILLKRDAFHLRSASAGIISHTRRSPTTDRDGRLDITFAT